MTGDMVRGIRPLLIKAANHFYLIINLLVINIVAMLSRLQIKIFVPH